MATWIRLSWVQAQNLCLLRQGYQDPGLVHTTAITSTHLYLQVVPA